MVTESGSFLLQKTCHDYHMICLNGDLNVNRMLVRLLTTNVTKSHASCLLKLQVFRA